MSNVTSREVQLKSRPVGMPSAENFELVTVTLPEMNEGQVMVQNIYMSVDPYMRGRMRDRKSYVPPFQVGEVLHGGAVGRVIGSKSDRFEVGDYVLSFNGWREAFVTSAHSLTKVDPTLAPLSTYLGIMGMPGRTAYFGLLDIGQPKGGETIFVSAAAGAVGSAVCQIAKIKGCRVVGSAGSAEKVDWLLHEIGVDAAFNYKESDDLAATLREHAPNGVDIYFENVGGKHLEAALANMNMYGRIPVCGMISQYNATEPAAAPRNLSSIIGLRVLLRGFIVGDYGGRWDEFSADMAPWLAEGKLKYHETIVHGIERAAEAFIGLFEGENLGKMLVQLDEII